jgi:hypothetical protein
MEGSSAGMHAARGAGGSSRGNPAPGVPARGHCSSRGLSGIFFSAAPALAGVARVSHGRERAATDLVRVPLR